MKTFMRSLMIISFLLCSLSIVAAAQEKKAAAPASTEPAKSSSTTPEKSAEAKPAEGGEKSAATKEDAELKAGLKEDKKEEEDEEKQFKESASVKWLGAKLGLSPTNAYWVSTLLNFAVITFLAFILLKSNLPKAFRDRTDAIRKGMEEASKASAEAKQRLGSIEERLAKLDSEIAEMQAATERDIRTEEDRLKMTAQEEARKIEESVKGEIETASTLARRELKQFAAELAVGLAEKKIQVSENADRALVAEFAARLDGGKGGK
jgi:F-type H+-transporting ATPase subunit b